MSDPPVDAARSTIDSASIVWSVASPAVIASTFWPKVELCTTARSIVSNTFSTTSLFAITAPTGHVAARERFGDRHEVGLDVPLLEREERARAAEPGLHLVDREQRAVAVTQLGRAAQVAVGRDEHTLALDRLDDERRDVAVARARAPRRRDRRTAPRAARKQRAEAVAELARAVERRGAPVVSPWNAWSAKSTATARSRSGRT